MPNDEQFHRRLSPYPTNFKHHDLDQAGFIKGNLPLEVLFRIGKNLDGPSLFVALQINRLG
ncbi:hypothetical protein BGX33_001600, partial [Mortierella sp. NVP41]